MYRLLHGLPQLAIQMIKCLGPSERVMSIINIIMAIEVLELFSNFHWQGHIHYTSAALLSSPDTEGIRITIF